MHTTMNRQRTRGSALPIVLIVLAGLLALGTILAITVVSTLNHETRISASIKAKQRDNANEMDGMWKTIDQVAQTTQAQKDALIEIFTGYAKARTGTGAGGSLANWIKEAVPTVDTRTFENLQNIITSKRDGFVMRQKELLDLSREHDQLLRTIPSGWICSIFGRKPIEVTIVTSTRTENAFQTGKDDDTTLFKK